MSSHQNWNSYTWVLESGIEIPVVEMTDRQVKKAIWATYLLVKYHPNFVWVYNSPLVSALMNRMRDHANEPTA